MSGILIWTIKESVENGLVFGSFDKVEANLSNYACLSIGSFSLFWKGIWSIRQLNPHHTITRNSVANTLLFIYICPHPSSNPKSYPKTNYNSRFNLKLKLYFYALKKRTFIDGNQFCMPPGGSGILCKAKMLHRNQSDPICTLASSIILFCQDKFWNLVGPQRTNSQTPNCFGQNA